MAMVKFLQGLSTAYQGLESKDQNTFYYTTDNNKVYLGEIELSTPDNLGEDLEALQAAVNKLNGTEVEDGSVKKQIKDAIDALKRDVIGDLSTLTTEIKDKVVNAINEVESEIEALTEKVGDLNTLETTEKGSIVGAINELNEDVKKFASQEAVTVEKLQDAGEAAAKYQIKQGGKAVGVTIDIPKDMVVESAEVKVLEEQDEQEHQPGTYIVLTIANKESSELWIPADKLVDIYTVAEDETNVKLTINQSDNTIKAEIEAGKITATELAANAVTTAKILDANVTKAKLAKEVTDSLAKADSALQQANIIEGSANGTISVKGEDVVVHGLKELAYKTEADLELGDLAKKNQSELDVAYDKKGSATQAETNAKSYTDTEITKALTWGEIA